MSLKIITIPNPILRQKAKPIARIDARIRKLASEMTVFLKKGEKKVGPKGKTKGIGLAAPQIGQSLRMAVVWSKPSHLYLAMINPEIVWKSRRTRLGVPSSSKKPLPIGRQAYEGCLSVPGVWGKVRRHSVIKVSYQTPTSQRVIRKFRGLTGVIIQHEIDHLDGILFTDRIVQQKGKLIKQE